MAESPFGTSVLPEYVRWVLAAFAVYRLSQLVAEDEGPADLILKIRTWAGCYDRGEDGRPRTSLGRLLECPYCLGVWFALAALAVVLVPTLIGDCLLAWWGLAGVQAYLEDNGG